MNDTTPLPEPAGFLFRHRAQVVESERFMPGQDTGYLYQFTRETQHLERFEANPALEVIRLHTEAYANARVSAALEERAAAIAELREENATLREIAAEYDAWIRFHDAGNGDFQDFIRQRVRDSGAEIKGASRGTAATGDKG